MQWHGRSMPQRRQSRSQHAKHRPWLLHHQRFLPVLLADRSVTATRRSHHPARRSRVISCQESAQSGHGSRLCPLGRHRNICCKVLPAAAASRLDEHKGKLQHIHDRNNHNMQGCDSQIVAGLQLATCGRVATRQLWQGCDSSLVAGLRLAILSYLEPNTQTNEPTNMQTTNQSIKRIN